MKILKIKLVGFNRIALSGYKTIEIDFTKKMQLILGSNGSGKSSLMYELSPLPANNSDLSTNGSKEIWIEHNHQNYYLANFKGGKCSFIDLATNEELNPGGTQAVQKELIRQIFKYDVKIHELLLGTENFTDMRPTRRKEWITELSDVNYDYALKVYANLKERLRDTQGALKLARKRLVEVNDKKIDSAREEVLRKEISDLEKKLESLNELRNQSINTVNEEELKRMIDSTLEDALSLMRVFRIEGKLDNDSLMNNLGQIKERGSALKKSMEETSQLLLEKQDQYSKMTELSHVDINQLKFKIEEKESIIKNNRNELVFGIEFDNPGSVLMALEAIYSELVDLLNRLHSNEHMYYAKSKYDALREELNNTQYNRNELDNETNRIKTELDHLSKHQNGENTECPNCHHQFNPFFSQIRFEELSKRYNRNNERLAHLTETIKQLEEKEKDYSNYFSLYNNIGLIIRSNPILNPFWNILANNKSISLYPKNVIVDLNKLKTDLLRLINNEELIRDIKDINIQLDKVNGVNKAIELQLKEQIDNLEIKYNQSLKELEEAKTEYERVKKQLDNQKELNQLESLVKDNLERIDSLSIQLLQSTFQTYLIDSIRIVQSQLGQYANEINTINNTNSVIKSVEDNIKQLESEEVQIKAIMSALSPTDGLIAKGLLGFINHLISQMNELINNMWSYPMVVELPKVDEEGQTELDYKFALIVGSAKSNVPDIGLGSKGQREIINLAFRIIACKYLGLYDVPIYADEFGTGLDETHRKKAANVIKTIVNEETYSQLFMISHYSDAHGSLVNAEVCVLSKDNITVPSVHNEHVRFE